MAISKVQDAAAFGNLIPTAGQTVSISTTGGNTLIATIEYYPLTTAVTGIGSITDSAGNTWHYSTVAANNPPSAVTLIGNGNYTGTAIGWCIGAAHVTSVTVKGTNSNNSWISVTISEWTGIGSADTGHSFGGTITGTSVQPGSITLAGTGELVVGAASHGQGSITTLPTGFSQFTSYNDPEECYQLNLSGTLNPSWTSSNTADQCTASVMAFLPTGIAVSPPTLGGATVNSLYKQQLSAAGGTGPYTYSITAGALPSWLTLDPATGLLQGAVPPATGSSSFTVTATDSLSATGNQAYTQNVVAPQPVGSPTGGPWTLAYNEEFDFPIQGNHTLVPNPKVWSDRVLYGDSWRSNMQTSGEQEWCPHNKVGLSVASSVLTIITRKEVPSNKASIGYDPAAPVTNQVGTTLGYTSGWISSRPGFTWTYGYMEARVQIPSGSQTADGYHPAFYENDPNGVWNSGPEFDIQEWFSGGNTCTYWYVGGSVNTPMGADGADGNYHTYAVRWSPTDVTYFYDGSVVVTFVTTTYSYTATNASPCVFTATGSAYGNGTPVQLSGGTPPTGFTNATTYFVVGASGATFQLAATLSGSAINSTSTGSGSVAVPASAITSRPQHIQLNVQVNGASTGTGYPTTSNVDYVRVWNVTGVPAQPGGVSVSPVTGIPSAGQLVVSFTAVGGATSYRASAIPLDIAADGFPNGYNPGSPYGTGATTGASSPLTVTGLTNGARYYVTVAAINATGYSIESLPVPPFSVPPGTPS